MVYLMIAIILACLSLGNARAHDAHRPDLNDWFNRLKSGKGPCCSNNDGTALSDVDWDTKDGRYRVRIEGKWIDVPDDAVVKEPNRDGRTMVWPMNGTFDSYGTLRSFDGISIRCFMPGAMI
jgi:hypothetical protein